MLSKAGLLTIVAVFSVSIQAHARQDLSPFDISEFLSEGQFRWNSFLSIFAGPKNVDQNLIQVTSDADSGQAEIKLELGANLEVLGLVHCANGVEKKRIPISVLSSGYELLKSGSLSVLKISSKGFTSQSGGVLDLVYLTNGITGSYDTFQMDILRSGDQWQVQTVEASPRIFTSMRLLAARFFGKPIGIGQVIIK